MKYLSLFSGIGGFELGIQQAYDNRPNIRNGDEVLRNNLPNTSEQSDRLTCVGYSEIDKYAIATYQSHFPERKNYGDITKINEQELPDFDLLVGGFPCQAFSIAGKRKGFEDTRGTLFFDIARIIKAKQPRLIFLENVKGLLSHDNGETFRTIIATLDELGYDLQWQVLNSKNHGVPQNRERVFIVGHLRGTSRPQVFPFGTDYKETSKCSVHTGTLTSRYPASQREGTYIEENGYRAGEIEQINQAKRTEDKIKVFIPEATKKGYAEATIGQSINLSVPNSKTRRGRVSDIAQTIDTGMQQHTLTEDMKIRRLTPTECERLQGFPDNWTIGSDTRRYKQCGNAVTVNVIRDIAEKLLTPPTKP